MTVGLRLASAETTLVVYMGVASMPEISARLIENGLDAATPVLAIASATTPQERRLTARLTDVAGEVTRAGMSAPVLFIIGRVVDLYDPAQLVPAALEVAEGADA